MREHLEQMNRERVAAGRKIIDAFRSNPQRGDALESGKFLEEAYLRIPRRGDPEDPRSNAVDIMVDLGHYLAANGSSFEAARAAVSRTESGNAQLGPADELVTDAAGILLSMKAFLEDRGKSFDRAATMAAEHLEGELETHNSPAPGL